MNKRLVTPVMLAVVMLTSVAQGREYTLKELVGEALRTSKEVQTVEREMDKADAQLWQAYGSGLPGVHAWLNYQYAWDSYSPIVMPQSDSTTIERLQAMYGGAAPLDGGDSAVARALDGMRSGIGTAINNPPRNTIALGLSLQQPIYSQGRVTLGVRIAKAYMRTLLCKYEAARRNAKADVTKLFYAALLAQKGLDVQRQALALAQETHGLAVGRLSVGTAGEIDTLATRYRLEGATMDVRSAEGRLRCAREALIKQAGLQAPVDSFSVEGEFPAEDFSISLSEATKRMYEGNKQIGQLNGTEAVQELLVRLQKCDYYPLVFCGATLGKYLPYNELDSADWNRQSSTDGKVFVGATYTLFDGLQRLQKVRQAQYDLEAFRLGKQRTLDGLEVALRNAFETMETNRLQVASAAVLVALAERGRALSKNSYEAGTMTLTELQDKELALKNALMAQSAAQFAFHSAVIDLRLLMGDLPLTD
jgi:outer membrane protein TolC